MSPQRMTTEELERTMRTLEPVYELVRVVDPSVTQGQTLTNDGALGLPHRCYDLLSKERRCKNCISARTVAGQCSVSKFEVVDDNAFFISTRYIEVDGKPRSLELVQRIDNGTLLSDNDGDSHATSLNELVEHDEQARYADDIPNVMNRAYLDEGINALSSGHVALMRVMSVTQPDSLVTQPVDAQTLKIVAASALTHMRTADTLVRYADDTFAILFESIPAYLFRERLAQIRTQALKAVQRDRTLPAIDIAIGGVTQEGLVRDLLVQAEQALVAASQVTRRIVMHEDDMDAMPIPALVGVPELGHHERHLDALTKLPTVGVFRHAVQELIDQLEPKDVLHVAHMDIENFKAFNRAHGLPEGDLLLVDLANAIRSEFAEDLVARCGVDTFEVATKANDVHDRIEHLCTYLDSRRRGVAILLKAGVYDVRDPNTDARLALDRAKIACDSIKGRFDQTVCLFDSKLERLTTMQSYVVHTLDEALASGYIQPYYQAIVRSFTSRVCSMEALSRWVDPTRGMISPADVIPTLERCHLIHKHDLHIVDCVCRDLRNCLDAGEAVVPISVNLSRLDFELCDIFEQIEGIVSRYRLDRSLLDIEVTESTFDDSNTGFHEQIERFRSAGYEIWMDDFGSGYSTLNLLKDVTFDVLKIDMDFLRGLERNQNSKEIIVSVVNMCKRLGIRPLAEGVETPTQFAFLRSIGCEMIQGYLFSRPQPGLHHRNGENLVMESLADRTYFESIGRVNLLSQQTAEAVSPTNGDPELHGMPLSIVEWNGSRVEFFTMNEAYQHYLHDKGYESVESAQRALNNNAQVQSLLQQIASGREDTSGAVRFVARRGPSIAFLFSPLHLELEQGTGAGTGDGLIVPPNKNGLEQGTG